MLFTPGPTEIEQNIRDIGSRQLPYFRGREYTDMVLEMTDNLKYLFQTKNTPLTLTSSGSGVMEMAIQNLLNPHDKVIVINCGTFGKKWVTMCRAFDVQVEEIIPELGRLPDLDILDQAITNDTKAILVTAHETSTGLLNDIQKIGELTRQRDVLLIVDAVSSIGADYFYTDEWNCDCAMVSTQKALACMPGLSFIVFSERAWEVIPTVQRNRYYFDAEEYMHNIRRGMLPYTPAMHATIQIHTRLKMIKETGLTNYIDKHKSRAETFRERILSSGQFSLFAERQSNSLTSFKLPEKCSMSEIIQFIKEKYDWYIAPNPTQDESYLRVSHMGDQTIGDLMELVDKIEEACHFFNHNKP